MIAEIAKPVRRKSAAPEPLHNDIPQKWLDLFRLIPGYDPVATAAPGERFDEGVAKRVIGFIENCCKHTDGAFQGQKFVLQDWQRAVTGCLFGWVKPDGTRRYRELFLYVPRGNGKTPWVAAMALYLLVADDEPSPKIYLIASDRPQADVLFTHMSGFVEQCSWMDKMVEARTSFHNKKICYKNDSENSFLQVMSSDGKGKHGRMPHAFIGEELHEWVNPKLLSAMETSFAKKGRRQPMKMFLTTADYDRESPCNDKYKWACMVRDNPGDDGLAGYVPQFLPVIYEATEKDDWRDEATWAKANPNLDITVDREQLRIAFDKAAAVPSELNELLRLHLNMRVQQSERPFDMVRWDANHDKAIDAWEWRESELEKRKGQTCEIGLDIAAISDLNAIALLFDDPDGGHTVIPFFWMPAKPSGVRRSDIVSEKLDGWRKHGWIREIPGEVADYDIMTNDIRGILKSYPPAENKISFDMLFQGLHISNELQKDGFISESVRTGAWTSSPANNEMIRLTTSGMLRHGGNPVLRWMVSNVMGIKKNGNLIFDKDQSVDKIDGVTATTMAIMRVMKRLAPPDFSIPLVSCAG